MYINELLVYHKVTNYVDYGGFLLTSFKCSNEVLLDSAALKVSTCSKSKVSLIHITSICSFSLAVF